MIVRGLGCFEDAPDERDFSFALHHPAGSVAARDADLRAFRGARIRQRWLSSCVAFGVARMVHMALRIEGVKDPPIPSPGFTWNRAMHRDGSGRPFQSRGTYPRNAFLSLQEDGFVPWDAWPYDELLAAPKPNEALPEPTVLVQHQAWSARDSRFYRIGGFGQDRTVEHARALSAKMPTGQAILVDGAFMNHRGSEPIRSIDTGDLKGGHWIDVLYIRPSDGAWLIDNWWDDWGFTDPETGLSGVAWLAPELTANDVVMRDGYALMGAARPPEAA